METNTIVEATRIFFTEKQKCKGCQRWRFKDMRRNRTDRFISATGIACFPSLYLRYGSSVICELFLWTLCIPTKEICINRARVKDKLPACLTMILNFSSIYHVSHSNFINWKNRMIKKKNRRNYNDIIFEIEKEI